jgi:hypothetical protein
MARSSGHRGGASVRAGGAGRPGPRGGSLSGGVIVEIVAAMLLLGRDCQQESIVATIAIE